MQALTQYRFPIALTVGLVVAVALRIVFHAGWIWAVPIGLATAGIAALVLAARGAGGSAAGLGDAQRREVELANSRIAALRRIAYAPGLEPLRETLIGISEAAKQIVADVTRQPADYPRQRRVLTHYLGHVETIAERLDHMRKNGPVDAGVLARTAATLGELRTIFEQYRQQQAAEDISDIDSRLAVLEIDIEVERR